MDITIWGPTIAIIGVNVAMFGGIATLVIWAINKLDADIKAIGARMDRNDARLDGHARRIDQLYHIIIDLLKNTKHL